VSIGAGRTIDQAVQLGGGQPIVLFVVNVAWFFCLHRLHLARAAKAAGYEVHGAAAGYTSQDLLEIRASGLHHHTIDVRRGGLSIAADVRLVQSLVGLYRALRPSVVHHVTIKPILYGTLAARLAGVGVIVNALAGLGFVFMASGTWAFMRRAAIACAYRILFAHPRVRVIFENHDDWALFVRKKIVRKEQSSIIRGVGVDLRRFGRNPGRRQTPLVVLPSRMLWFKGVREFCEAATMVRAAGVTARFALVGRLDQENPTAVPESWLLDQQSRGAVEWWGHHRDMPSVYAMAHTVCLPSYGEGLPTVLLEGAASGCALVATDVAGCKEVVRDGQTGLLVPPRDVPALARALAALLGDDALWERLSAAAYREVSEEFSEELVQRRTVRLYDQSCVRVRTACLPDIPTPMLRRDSLKAILAWIVARKASARTSHPPLYPATASETAAGVVPVNRGHRPGDVRRYGATADDKSDSTEALQQAIRCLGPKGELVFEPNGIYRVRSGSAHRLRFDGLSGFTVKGQGATVRVLDGEPVAGDCEILMFTHCTDGLVQDLTIDANRDRRRPVVTTAHSIVIRSGCARLHFRRVRSINAVMDGFIVDTSTENVESSYPTDIVLEDCQSSRAYRNGLSIIASLRCRVRGGSYTGTTGTAPQAGIDIEPDETTTFGNADLAIEGVEVSGNSGYGLMITVSGGKLLNGHVVLRNIKGSANARGLILADTVRQLEVDGVECGTHSQVSRGIIDLASGGELVRISLRNLTFAPQPVLDDRNFCIFDQAAVSGGLSIENVTARGIACHLMQTGSNALVSNVSVQMATADPVIVVAGGMSHYAGIRVEGCAGRAFYASAATQLDQATLIDCVSRLAAVQFDRGSGGSVVRNVTVRQRAGIPGGAVAIYFNSAPRLIENVHAVASGQDYTSASIFKFVTGSAGTTIRGCTPEPPGQSR
jgi:glycosyltransferase involved in cell wall biosynthesis